MYEKYAMILEKCRVVSSVDTNSSEVTKKIQLIANEPFSYFYSSSSSSSSYYFLTRETSSTTVAILVVCYCCWFPLLLLLLLLLFLLLLLLFLSFFLPFVTVSHAFSWFVRPPCVYMYTYMYNSLHSSFIRTYI